MDSTTAVALSTHNTGIAALHQGDNPTVNPFARLAPDLASQAQILRAHQRDTIQIGRLTELVSELLRSLTSTRWLAHRQTIIDLITKTVYLLLTIGSGHQTLGEEYTDILPYVGSRRVSPSRTRRLLTILFLLVPSLISSSIVIGYLHSESLPNTLMGKAKARLKRLIEFPLVQSLPEIHLVMFMLGGRYYEYARRLTGLQYISALAPRPPHARPATYEPLGLLMALPLLYRIFPRSYLTSTVAPVLDDKKVLHSPLPTEAETVFVVRATVPDDPNTYLTPDAQALSERQCTLCLEPRGTSEGSGGTVAVTECGHVFCWGCLGGLEKMECPLCRQTLRMERLVAAYNL